MDKTIYIVRHCKAEGQAADAPLTEEGFSQAKKLGKFLADKDIDRVITSPFLRAMQSVRPFAAESNLEVEIDNRLKERVLSTVYLPDWLDKLEATFHDMDLKYEGGESSNEAKARIIETVEEILEDDGGNTVIVAHGGIISLLLTHFDKNFGFEGWKSLSNPDVFQLNFYEKDPEIKRIWRG